MGNPPYGPLDPTEGSRWQPCLWLLAVVSPATELESHSLEPDVSVLEVSFLEAFCWSGQLVVQRVVWDPPSQAPVRPALMAPVIPTLLALARAHDLSVQSAIAAQLSLALAPSDE